MKRFSFLFHYHFQTSGYPRFRTDTCIELCTRLPIKIMAFVRNASQCRSLPIDIGINARICTDRNWSELINIDRHFGSMPWFWSALIEGVLQRVTMEGADPVGVRRGHSPPPWSVLSATTVPDYWLITLPNVQTFTYMPTTIFTLSILVFYLRMEIPFYNCCDGFSIVR